MTVDLPEDFVDRLRKLAATDLISDDENYEFDIYSRSGGNFDDAFSIGVDEGEVCLAREIVAHFPNSPTA